MVALSDLKYVTSPGHVEGRGTKSVCVYWYVVTEMQLVKNGSRTPSQCDSPLVLIHHEGDEESPPVKLFKHLEKVIEQRWKEDLEKSAQLPPEKAEVERYLFHDNFAGKSRSYFILG